MSDIENLWFSLSFLFVDNEVDYKQIASEISAHSVDTIEFHLFYNVAPICSVNIEQLIPTIWTGFDKVELIRDIKQHGIIDKDQITLRRKIAASLYKLKYRDDWYSLKNYLQPEMN